MTYADPAADETGLFAQVRRLTVHDDIHGGYRPAIIGYWDYLGYTCCLAHPPDPDQDPSGIWCDNSAAEGDRCDWPGCGVSLLTAALHRRRRARVTVTLTEANSASRRCLTVLCYAPGLSVPPAPRAAVDHLNRPESG